MNTKPTAAESAFAKLADVASCRSDLYTVFMVAFSNPSSELICDIQDGVLVDDIKACLDFLVVDETIYTNALNQLQAHCTTHQSDDPEALLRELRTEYMRLFIGPKQPVVPAYETLHREKPGKDSNPVLFVSPTVGAVERFYRDVGLVLELRDSPDHITIELSFLSSLCSKESDAWVVADNDAARPLRQKERNFLDEHLGLWGKDFCQQTYDADQTGFYAAISALFLLFLHMEVGGFKAA